MRSIEIKASSVEKATEEGLSQLGISKENAEVEVVSEGGLFSKAVVRISEKERPGDRAREFLKTLFEKMRLNCEVGCESEDGVIKVSITGPDSGIAIGYRGEVLDAIQYLTLLIANEGEDKFEKVVINAENYREKREKTLEGLAKKLAYKAGRSGKPIELEPMNPFERRIIHTALQDNPYVTTSSEGVEPRRHIVITPKERAGKDAPVKDFSVKRNGPPKVKSFGYKKRRF